MIINPAPNAAPARAVKLNALQVVAAAERAGLRPGQPEPGSGAGSGWLGGLAKGFSNLFLGSAPRPAVLVLVCAPSNAAVDEIAGRLVQRPGSGPLPAGQLLRVNSFMRARDQARAALEGRCSFDIFFSP